MHLMHLMMLFCSQFPMAYPVVLMSSSISNMGGEICFFVRNFPYILRLKTNHFSWILFWHFAQSPCISKDTFGPQLREWQKIIDLLMIEWQRYSICSIIDGPQLVPKMTDISNVRENHLNLVWSNFSKDCRCSDASFASVFTRDSGHISHGRSSNEIRWYLYFISLWL